MEIAYCRSLGVVLGAMAGFASRSTEPGISYLPCFVIVALSAFIVRYFTAPDPKFSDADQHYFSHIAALVAAATVTGILILIGQNRQRAEHRTDLPT